LPAPRSSRNTQSLAILLLLGLAGLLIHGYYLGIEDQAIHLPAIATVSRANTA